ncbi:MAG: hypothetical protein OXN89_03300 [Bryobacterales bacterium]|nr:hypothetical protein [Bryobacterales bacterium]
MKINFKMVVTVIVVLLFAIPGYWVWANLDFLKARNALNKGVGAFTAGDFVRAGTYFEEAADLDPELGAARVYGAYSTMMQYQPGAEYKENLDIAHKALDGFKAVLEDDPTNATALQSIASLYFNMKEMELAKEWHGKVLEQQPDYKESYYTIGVIAWTQSYEPRLEFRANAGLAQEDPGPIAVRGRLNRSQREEYAALKEEIVPKIDEGLVALEEALKIDEEYDDAMAYVNLLYREKADLADSTQEHDQLLATADEWVDRALETRRRKAEESTIEAFTTDE